MGFFDKLRKGSPSSEPLGLDLPPLPEADNRQMNLDLPPLPSYEKGFSMYGMDMPSARKPMPPPPPDMMLPSTGPEFPPMPSPEEFPMPPEEDVELKEEPPVISEKELEEHKVLEARPEAVVSECFVSKPDIISVLDNIEKMSDNIGLSNDMLFRVSQIQKDSASIYALWQSTLENIEDSLIYLDKTIYTI